MTDIERILNDGFALQNITDGNPFHHNADWYHHQIVIFIQVVNDAAPCKGPGFKTQWRQNSLELFEKTFFNSDYNGQMKYIGIWGYG